MAKNIDPQLVKVGEYLKLDEDYKNSDFLNFDFFILETIIVPDMQENMQ